MAFRLNSRDYEIMISIAEHRLVTVQHVVALHDRTRPVTVFWNRSYGDRAEVDYVLRSDEQGWLIESRDVRRDVFGCY